MRLPTVIHLTWALLVEIYREYGLKFDEAIKELNTRLYSDPDVPRTPKPPTPEEEAASMAMLQSMIGGSSFGGPRG